MDYIRNKKTDHGASHGQAGSGQKIKYAVPLRYLHPQRPCKNSSGSVTEKQPLSYADFERLFINMEWDNYHASPTITVYQDNELPLLWVALFATSENEDKARMFIIEYKRMEERKVSGFG